MAQQETKYPIDINFAKSKLVTNVAGPLAGFGNFTTLQNMEYTDTSIRAVTGMTKINTSAITTYVKARACCHFKKSTPTPETHVIAQCYDVNNINPRLLENTTAIPDQGAFSGTALWTDTAGGFKGHLNSTVDGSVIYCNGVDTVVWGGTEYRCGGFIVSNAASTNLYDYTEQITNSLTDATNLATLVVDTTITYYILSTRKLKGFKVTMGTPNAVASTVAVSYFNSSGSWAAVSNLSDGTASGGVTHAQTGSITFDSTVSVANLTTINGVIAYAYKVVITKSGATPLAAGVTVTKCTVDAPFQTITDIWDGVERTLFSVQTYEGAYVDVTTNVLENTYDASLPETYLPMAGGFNTTESIVFGAEERLMGVIIYMPPDGTRVGTTATSLNIKYWNGVAWVACSGVKDNTVDTDTRTKPLNQSGMITWTPPDFNSERVTQIGNEKKLYYYQITPAANISVAIRIVYMKGIAAPVQIRGHRLSTTWQNRPVLCCEQADKRNIVWVGGPDSTSIWNGQNSIKIPIGENIPVIAAMPMFLRYGSAVNEILVVCTQDEAWVIEGTNPDDYVAYRVSSLYGCLSTETMDLCDIGFTVSPENIRQIMIWLSSGGLVKFDGHSITPLPSDRDDIFNPASSNYYYTEKIDYFYGFFNPNKKTYTFLYGIGSDTMNKELVYDVLRNKTYDIERGANNYIQCATVVSDTLGNKYIYAFKDNGYMVRLDNGTNFDNTAIACRVRLADSPLSTSLAYKTKLLCLKIFTKAESVNGGELSISHYGDLSTTASTPAGLLPSTDLDISGSGLFIYRKYPNYGPNYYHSLKLSINEQNEAIGFEPFAISLYVEVTPSP